MTNVHDNLLPQNLGFHKLLVAKEPYRSILCGGHSVLNFFPFVLDPSETFCLIMGLMYNLQNVSISAIEAPECSSRSMFSNVLWEATDAEPLLPSPSLPCHTKPVFHLEQLTFEWFFILGFCSFEGRFQI